MQRHNETTLFYKITACMLAFVCLLSAGAVTAAAAEKNDTVADRLLAVKAVYPDKYEYFTVSGSACWYAQGSDCRLSRIPSRGGLPAGEEAASWEGWSCVGFARYVFYCVFGENFSTAGTADSPSVGDVIHTVGPGSDHCSVFLREDDENWYVFDANWGNGSGVRWEGKIAKDVNTLLTVYHAKSYDAAPVGSLTRLVAKAASDVTENPAGDVDMDGAVTSGDARQALRYALKLDALKPASPAFTLCDVDGNKKITSSDARIILRTAIGLEENNTDMQPRFTEREARLFLPEAV